MPSHRSILGISTLVKMVGLWQGFSHWKILEEILWTSAAK
jgi:hypothetical protein